MIILCTVVVFNARNSSDAGGGRERSQNPDLMNKKSLWLKGDWFVSSWVAFYSALERRGVLIDKTPPLARHPPALPPSLVPVTPESSSTMDGTLSLEILDWKREGANLCSPREFTEMIILGAVG